MPISGKELQEERAHLSLPTNIRCAASAIQRDTTKGGREDVSSPDELAHELDKVSLSEQHNAQHRKNHPRNKTLSQNAHSSSGSEDKLVIETTPSPPPKHWTRSYTQQQRSLHTQTGTVKAHTQQQTRRKNDITSLEESVEQVSLSSNRNADHRHKHHDTRTRVPWTTTKLSVQGFGDTIPPLQVPQPSSTYLLRTTIAPKRLSKPQTLLIIVDLNGTLIYRRRGRGVSHIFHPRPGLSEFLNYLFPPISPDAFPHVRNHSISQMQASSSHKIMIWSSARPENVTKIVAKMLEPSQRDRLCAIWARDKFDMSRKQYNAKVQVYKQLDKVWNSTAVQKAYPRFLQGSSAGDGNDAVKKWGQHNTLILEDSPLKCVANPHNIVLVPELLQETLALEKEREGERNVLRQVSAYLDECAYWDDVSAYVRLNPFIVDKVE